jgi:hypothetical protein
MKKKRGRPSKKTTMGDRLVKRAVQVSVADDEAKVNHRLAGELVPREEFPAEVDAVLLEHTDMLREEFYTRVTTKMQGLVDDLLDDLKERYRDIPPQNIAYSLGVLMKEVNNLNGRPQTLTSSINFGFGPKNRTREEVAALLVGEGLPSMEEKE